MDQVVYVLSVVTYSALTASNAPTNNAPNAQIQANLTSTLARHLKLTIVLPPMKKTV
jgi:hypothetical protein